MRGTPAPLVTTWQLPNGADVVIRTIRPEDAELTQTFVRDLSEETKYFRYMDAVRELSQAMLVRFTQIDYDREMALLAVTMVDGKEVELGVARSKGLSFLDGEVLKNNRRMLKLAEAWASRSKRIPRTTRCAISRGLCKRRVDWRAGGLPPAFFFARGGEGEVAREKWTRPKWLPVVVEPRPPSRSDLRRLSIQLTICADRTPSSRHDRS